MADNINPVRGDQLPALWLPQGLGLVTLNIHDDNLDIEALLLDVTNTGSGGLTSRLAGKLDASGTINATFDLNAPPYLAPLFVLPGQSGVYGKGMSPNSAKSIQVPAIIGKVHYQSGVDSELKYSFDVKMNARAGFLVYPSN